MPKAQGTTFQHVHRLLAAALVVSNRLFFWSRVFARAQRNTMCCIICVKENQTHTHTHTRTMLTNLWSTFQQHPWTFNVTLKWSMLNWIHLLVTLGIACLPNKCWLSSQAVMKKLQPTVLEAGELASASRNNRIWSQQWNGVWCL